jgi:hypothetical protein
MVGEIMLVFGRVFLVFARHAIKLTIVEIVSPMFLIPL